MLFIEATNNLDCFGIFIGSERDHIALLQHACSRI
jgi:hypothetical protein